MRLLTQLTLVPMFIAALTHALPLERPTIALAEVSEQRPFQHAAAALPLPSLYHTEACTDDSTPASSSISCARAKLAAIWDRLQDKYRNDEQEEPKPRMWFLRDTNACRTPCPSGTGTCSWRMCAGIRVGRTVLEVGIRAPSTALPPPPLS